MSESICIRRWERNFIEEAEEQEEKQDELN